MGPMFHVVYHIHIIFAKRFVAKPVGLTTKLQLNAVQPNPIRLRGCSVIFFKNCEDFWKLTIYFSQKCSYRRKKVVRFRKNRFQLLKRSRNGRTSTKHNYPRPKFNEFYKKLRFQTSNGQHQCMRLLRMLEST